MKNCSEYSITIGVNVYTCTFNISLHYNCADWRMRTCIYRYILYIYIYILVSYIYQIQTNPENLKKLKKVTGKKETKRGSNGQLQERKKNFRHHYTASHSGVGCYYCVVFARRMKGDEGVNLKIIEKNGIIIIIIIKQQLVVLLVYFIVFFFFRSNRNPVYHEFILFFFTLEVIGSALHVVKRVVEVQHEQFLSRIFNFSHFIILFRTAFLFAPGNFGICVVTTLAGKLVIGFHK